MRLVVLDTETTGLDHENGDRIIEIGCQEIIARRETEQILHHYINPERDISSGAIAIHGITEQQLCNAPLFSEIVEELVDFIRDSTLLIHNAAFDIGFLDMELQRLGGTWQPVETYCEVVDTLSIARQRHPGQKNSLDALCRRYRIDNSERKLHSALLDAQLLARVYLAMTGGQTSLELNTQAPVRKNRGGDSVPGSEAPLKLRVLPANTEERKAHQETLEDINRQSEHPCLWPAPGETGHQDVSNATTK